MAAIQAKSIMNGSTQHFEDVSSSHDSESLLEDGTKFSLDQDGTSSKDLSFKRTASTVTLIETSEHIRTASKPDPSFVTRLSKKSRAVFACMFLKHGFVKVLQFAAVFYVCIYMFCFEQEPDSVDAKRGFIVTNGSERPLVAETTFQEACIVLARISAYYMYPRELWNVTIALHTM